MNWITPRQLNQVGQAVLLVTRSNGFQNEWTKKNDFGELLKYLRVQKKKQGLREEPTILGQKL